MWLAHGAPTSQPGHKPQPTRPTLRACGAARFPSVTRHSPVRPLCPTTKIIYFRASASRQHTVAGTDTEDTRARTHQLRRGERDEVRLGTTVGCDLWTRILSMLEPAASCCRGAVMMMSCVRAYGSHTQRPGGGGGAPSRTVRAPKERSCRRRVLTMRSPTFLVSVDRKRSLLSEGRLAVVERLGLVT